MNAQPVFCPVCGHAPFLSATEKFVQCRNQDCPLGAPDFFVRTTVWNEKAPVVEEKLADLVIEIYLKE